MSECSNKDFGAYIKALRQGVGLTQAEAALQASLSPPYLSQLERGHRDPPSRAALCRLAETYHVTPQSLWSHAEYGNATAVPLSPERVEWLFLAASSDPAFSYGQRARREPLTLDQKMWFVELWQKMSGRNLLTAEELRGMAAAAEKGEGE